MSARAPVGGAPLDEPSTTTSTSGRTGERAAERRSLAMLQSLADALLAEHAPHLPPVAVRLSSRMTRSAGTYRPPGDIAISRHFLREHGLEATVPVLRHELAHHLARAGTGPRTKPHGKEFRGAAAALEAPLHAPAFAAPRRVYAYRCPGCGWTWLRGRRIARGRRYACGRCASRYDDRFRLRFAGTWREP